MIILKILLAPFALALRILIMFLAFVVSVSGGLLSIVSVLGFILAVAVFFFSGKAAGAALMFCAYLISPLGIPALAAWIIGGLGGVYAAMRQFIFG